MVSFVVPVYNVEKYLPRCINSICSQTYRDFELILVDDGSTDNCPVICDEFAGKDRRITVIHKSNGGLVSARKAGLAIAQGQYVSCIDSDDWIEQDMLQKLLDIKTDADIIAFAGYEECEGYQGVKRNTLPEGSYKTKEQLEKLYKKMLMNGNFFENGISTSIWNKLFKRKLLEKCQMNVSDVISYGEDTVCVYSCILAADSIYVTNMLLYHYQMRQGSIVRGAKISEGNFKYLYQTCKSMFDTHPQKDCLNVQLRYYMWHALLLKAYEKIDGKIPLFPYRKVKIGMRIAIYGAGLFGQVIERFCRMSNTLFVVGWFDKRYKVYCQQGLSVSSADDVMDFDFDIMVIAILNSKLAEQIKADYIRLGITEHMIDVVDVSILDKTPLPAWLKIKEEE